MVFTDGAVLSAAAAAARENLSSSLYSFHSTSSVSSVVLIMSVFDLQLSLSHRDPSQHEILPTTPLLRV